MQERGYDVANMLELIGTPKIKLYSTTRSTSLYRICCIDYVLITKDPSFLGWELHPVR